MWYSGCLGSHEALSSNPTITKRKMGKKNQERNFKYTYRREEGSMKM
jgi:hypothetical protein